MSNKKGVTIYPDNYKNMDDKEKNDLIAHHLTKILEIRYSELNDFKEKNLISLYFKNNDGSLNSKVKVLFQLTNFKDLIK